jgi:hypothetical protein
MSKPFRTRKSSVTVRHRLKSRWHDAR